ncbi:MAG TPA: MASE1 domain-containing protein, partial [Arenimonas sp.]|nr:MASE1 domain-containing protein [Arenimonas sp.]
MHAIPPLGGYRWSDLPKLLGLALLFAGLVKLVLAWFSTQEGLVALVWAPSGVALAALLLWGERFWLGIFAGALLLNISSGQTVFAALAFSAGHALEALLAVWMLERWLHFDRRVEQTRDYLGLLLAAAGAALFAATLGALVLRANGNIDSAQMLPTLLNWWQGDALGMALVTPFLLIWAQPFEFGRGRWRRAEAVLLAAISLIIGGIVFLGADVTGLDETPRLYLMFALLPWAALRFGRHGASLLVMLTAVMAAIGVVQGNVQFGAAGGVLAHYNLWLYLLVLSVVGTTSALTLKQLRRAEWRARAAQTETQALLEQAEQSQAVLESTLASQLRAEAALAEQNAFLETMLDNEPECVKLLDAKGRLQQMNRAGLDMLEVDSVEQAREIGLASFVLPEFREAFQSLHRRVCAGEGGQLQFRVEGRHGTRRWLETHAVPFRASEGDAIGMLAVTRDISRRKYAEARDALQAQVMRLIATGEPLSDVLTCIVAGVEGLRPDCRCSVLLLDADGRHLHIGAAPSLPSHFNAAVEGQEIGPRAGSCGTAAWRGERVVVADIDSDP